MTYIITVNSENAAKEITYGTCKLKPETFDKNCVALAERQRARAKVSGFRYQNLKLECKALLYQY